MAKIISPVEKTVRKITGKALTPYQKLLIADCVPNDWNPNVMAADLREKLARGMKHLLDVAGILPPVVVRPHPDPTQGKWQIIDGYHRWDILRTEGYETVDGYILNVDTKTAMILTDSLNYLRGEPLIEDYAKYYQRLLNEHAMTPFDASQYLVSSSDEIQKLLDDYELRIDNIEVPSDPVQADDEDKAPDSFVEAKFVVSLSQQEVIERELARIGSLMTGKNIRGRALEYMAVNSSQTPLDNLTGEDVADVEDVPKAKLSRMKKKLKECAA